MNCRECKEHLYEYLDRELTPAVEQEIRQHIADCPPCGEEFDFEKLFLGFLRARCRAQGAPPDLKRRILDERSEEHTSELQSQSNLVCRLLLEKKTHQTYDAVRC